MNKPVIFLDMDGVLCDFVTPMIKTLGIEKYTIPPGVSKIENWPGVEMDKDAFQAKLDSCGYDYWKSFEKYSWSDELVALCESFGDVRILTAPTRNPGCASGKTKWINKHYPQRSKCITITRDKHFSAAPDRILIDDTEEKIDKFLEYKGKGILFPQRWNRNHRVTDHVTRLEYVRVWINAHIIEMAASEEKSRRAGVL